MKKLLIFLAAFVVLISHPTLVHAQFLDPEMIIVNINRDTIKTSSEYKAPLVYNKWWGEVRICAHLTNKIPLKPMFRLKWISVKADAFYVNGNFTQLAAASTFPWDDEIWVTFLNILNKKVIKHEMLHYMLWQSGMNYHHDNPLFIKCKLDQTP